MYRWILAGLAGLAIGAPALAQNGDVRTITIEAEASGSASTRAHSGTMSLSLRFEPELDWPAVLQAAADESGAALVARGPQGPFRMIVSYRDNGDAQASELPGSVPEPTEAWATLRGDVPALRSAFNHLRDAGATVIVMHPRWRPETADEAMNDAFSAAIGNAANLAEAAASSQSCALGDLLGMSVGRSNFSTFDVVDDEIAGGWTLYPPLGDRVEITFPEEPMADIHVAITATFEAECPVD